MSKRHYQVIFLLDAYLQQDERESWHFASTDHSGTVTLAEWRLRAAEKLFAEQMVDRIVCVGANTSSDVSGMTLNVEVMRQALVEGYKVPPERVEVLVSPLRTRGNAKAIAEYLSSQGIGPSDSAVLTNFYHLPRAANFILKEGLGLRLMAAECFFVEESREEILRDYGCADAPFGSRLLGELKGMRDLEYGTYGR